MLETWGYNSQLEYIEDWSDIWFFDPEFEGAIADQLSVSNLDEVLDEYLELEPNGWETAMLGTLLATTAHEREAVKLGISLIGITGIDFDRETLFTLGKHPEFTLYSVVALSRTIADSEEFERVLMELFQFTEEWGRVRVLDALTQSPSPGVKL